MSITPEMEAKRLPKLYAPVTIRFSSLRDWVGESGGVHFDIDELIERKAMRVISGDSWKWQIKDIKRIGEWDHFVYQDQLILNDCGSELEFSIKVRVGSKE